MPGETPFSQSAMGTPNRGTSEQQLDQWNRAMRQSPVYLDYMRRHGLPTDGRVKLSRQQQEGLEHSLRAAGFEIPSGMHIDQGGNLNQKNRLVRNSLIAAGVAGGGLAGLGAAGIGPFSGLAGGGVPAGVGSAEFAVSSSPFSMAAPTVTTAAAGGAGSGITGAGAAGLGGVASGAGSGAIGGAKGAGAGVAGAGKGFLGGMSARDLAGLGLAGASAIGGAMNRPDFGPNSMATDPQMAQILQMMMSRLQKSEPLHDSVLSMANGLLPMQYQKGGGGMG